MKRATPASPARDSTTPGFNDRWPIREDGALPLLVHAGYGAALYANPMSRSDLLALARAGAQARLNDIEVERQRLLRSFAD